MNTDQLAAEALKQIQNGRPNNAEEWATDDEILAIIKAAIEKATEPLLSILKEGASKNGLFKSACREAIANHESRAAHASEQSDDTKLVAEIARESALEYEGRAYAGIQMTISTWKKLLVRSVAIDVAMSQTKEKV